VAQHRFDFEIVLEAEPSPLAPVARFHADGIAIDFECAPDETFQVQAQRGLIVHATHWQSPVALFKLKEIGIVAMPAIAHNAG
jgi:hypothetical protein